MTNEPRSSSLSRSAAGLLVILAVAAAGALAAGCSSSDDSGDAATTLDPNEGHNDERRERDHDDIGLGFDHHDRRQRYYRHGSLIDLHHRFDGYSAARRPNRGVHEGR